MKKFKVSEQDKGKRVDVFLAEKLPELSRSFIQKLCDKGKIEVNCKEAKDKQKVKVDDSVSVNLDLSDLVKADSIKLQIIYEDDNCIVLNKPAGLLTHSKGSYNSEATVATFIESKTKKMDGNRAGIVHRLDRATSGVIICAKTPKAMSFLQKQFSLRKVKKTYIAIIEGELEPKSAVIDMPIERHPAKPKIFRVGANGKEAITKYETLSSKNNLSILQLSPKTGRTHQLRVHLSQLKHPIVGDFLYGGKDADRLYLHALSLEITLPGGKRKVFKTDLPKEFNELMQ